MQTFIFALILKFRIENRYKVFIEA